MLLLGNGTVICRVHLTAEPSNERRGVRQVADRARVYRSAGRLALHVSISGHMIGRRHELAAAARAIFCERCIAMSSGDRRTTLVMLRLVCFFFLFRRRQ